MATFVLMTKLAPEVQRQMKDRQEIGKQFLATVSKKCPGVRWIAHYALLGPYAVYVQTIPENCTYPYIVFYPDLHCPVSQLPQFSPKYPSDEVIASS